METVLKMIIDPDNVRMVLMVVLGWSGFVLIKSQMKEMGHSLNKHIYGVEASLNKKIDDLRHNDLAAINKRIDGVEASLSKRIDGLDRKIDGVEVSLSGQIYDLKHNDFAHLNATVIALTYALEKNGALKREDKEYVDSRLAH